ncbi:hypothetical protein HS041_23280 [Planomonospora sp. ID67723]|uniref:hypothetical protein n=1 Tax=Planomonospora sp. ID67723 TaxID=2738134 RepID=UPI0018C434BA|nr:hypothetical protein [Planomonospora sp. ID67723]MBG0830687.1 hypothetical protein [Planomonospora sp. ID67723]
MTETDPQGAEAYDPEARVPDDREDSAGADAPSGDDPKGPAAQIPDDRKAAARSEMPDSA